MAVRFFPPVPQFIADAGGPAVGWTLYFYEPGTSTPKAVYSDEALTTPAGTSVTLDASGSPETDIYLDGLYKVVMEDADGVTKWTRDDFGGFVDNEDLQATYATKITSPTSGNLVSMDANGDIQDAGVAVPGMVLQTAQTVDTTNRSTTSTTFVTSGVAVTLSNNLRDTSSKVRIRAQGQFGHSSTSNEVAAIALYRDDTDLTPAGVNGIVDSVLVNGSLNTDSFSFEYEDSPGTTTPPTYTLYFKTNSGTLYLGRRGNDTVVDAPTIITAEEIAG